MSSLCSKNTLLFVKNTFCTNQHKKTIVSLVKRNHQFFKYSNKRHSSTSSKVSKFISNGVNYFLTITVGVSGGLLTGYWFIQDQRKSLLDQNEETRPLQLVGDFTPTKQIVHKDSPYYKFPLRIHLYQYENCPYCSQVRAYLDYFGFSYTLTEVDSYNKEELTKITKSRSLPFVVLENTINNQKWHLSNATNILSALESVRNEKFVNFKNVIDRFLPVLKDTGPISSNKYNVLNSDLNSIEWRKWINNTAIPIFNLNSVDNLKDLFEKFDCTSEKSGWKFRYNTLKYYYVYYKNVLKTYKLLPNLKNRLELEDRGKDPRELLDKCLLKWEKGLGDKDFISGTNKPNLADLSMYGNVKSYEGCTVFRESIAKYPKFRRWFEKMNMAVCKGYQKIDTRSIAYLIEVLDENLEETTSQPEAQKTTPVREEKIEKTIAKPILHEKIQTNEKLIFRVLSATYLVHVFAFAYASYMNK